MRPKRVVMQLIATGILLLVIASECLNKNDTTEDAGHLRVVVAPIPPLFMMHNNSVSAKTEYSGFAKDLMDLLSTSLGFTYSFVVLSTEEIKKAGAAGAAVGYLLKKEVDMVAIFASPSPERIQLMDFTTAIAIDQYAMLQPMPTVLNQYTAPIKPFQAVVWLLILIALMVVSIFIGFFILGFGRSRNKTKMQVVSDQFIYTLQVITAHGCALKNNKSAVRFLAAVWCLMAVILINYYNSTLISYMLVPKYEPIVNTIEELAHSTKLSVSAEKSSVIGDTIFNAESGHLKTLGDSLRQNSDHVIASINQLELMLKSGCCAFFAAATMCDNYVYKYMKANGGQCLLTRSQPVGYPGFFSYVMAKNSPHLQSFDRQLIRMRESGVIDFLIRKYMKHTDKCSLKTIEKESTEGKPMALHTIVSAFFILGLGLGVSLISFAAEFIVSWISKKCIKKSTQNINKQ